MIVSDAGEYETPKEALERMYHELTDPDIINQNKLRYERQKRIEARKIDSGIIREAHRPTHR